MITIATAPKTSQQTGHLMFLTKTGKGIDGGGNPPSQIVFNTKKMSYFLHEKSGLVYNLIIKLQGQIMYFLIKQFL